MTKDNSSIQWYNRPNKLCSVDMHFAINFTLIKILPVIQWEKYNMEDSHFGPRQTHKKYSWLTVKVLLFAADVLATLLGNNIEAVYLTLWRTSNPSTYFTQLLSLGLLVLSMIYAENCLLGKLCSHKQIMAPIKSFMINSLYLSWKFITKSTTESLFTDLLNMPDRVTKYVL